ncbi:MAG: hypothetical protein IID46_16510, partial [Planctomycetes bacterium]|nr:hypothetical protein [Planctomycetota bacterium]
MKPGRKWMFLVPVVVVGLGFVVTSGIPTLGSSEAKPIANSTDQDENPFDSAASAKTKKSELPWLEEPKRLQSAKSVKLPFVENAATVSKFPSRIVRTAAQFPDAVQFPDKDETRKIDPSHIPAKGPDAGKTVNPEQPIPVYRKSVGAQDASLTVDWVTPESILLMKQGKFDLVLRNRGRIAIEQITIANVLPKGFRFVKSEPLPTMSKPKRVWIIKKL